MARALACITFALLAMAACQKQRPVVHEELRVLAASSLTEAFEDVASAFEAQHPDVTVLLNFAGSQVLRLQIEQGAPADVFASANEAHMDALVQAGRVDDVSVFARNTLVLAVPLQNPAHLERFEDLARVPRVVLGAPTVPVGAYTKDLLERAREAYGDEFVDAINRHVISYEANVRLALAKVQLGEADAAFVYNTDVQAAGRAKAVALPDELVTPTRYVVAKVLRTHTLQSTARFMRFLLSSQGQALLRKRGFLAVPAP